MHVPFYIRTGPPARPSIPMRDVTLIIEIDLRGAVRCRYEDHFWRSGTILAKLHRLDVAEPLAQGYRS
jgi:hypothetical protein